MINTSYNEQNPVGVGKDSLYTSDVLSNTSIVFTELFKTVLEFLKT